MLILLKNIWLIVVIFVIIDAYSLLTEKQFMFQEKKSKYSIDNG